jgi:hypothetical protein
MTEAHWAFSVRDQHGRTRRGRVVYSDRADAVASGPGGFAEFVILILAEHADVADVPPGTAICVPKPQKLHALRDVDANKMPSRLQDLTLRPYRMAEYAGGRIVMSPGVAVSPADIFPPNTEHPRLDRIALALLQALDAEAMAPYTALIRHELALPPGADALAELEARLAPGDPKSSPPARAPAVLRLAKALRRMRQRATPEITLEEMTEDLKFLRLFEDDGKPWARQALERLLGDVRNAAAPKERRRRTDVAPEAPPANVVPLRRDRTDGPPPEDA